ncbi:MAG: cytochrome c3 family protein [Gemmatimonadales bacterium]
MIRRGWVAAIALALVAAAVAPAGAQVSPGPLARAHQDLEGALKCTRCHGGGANAMTEKCQACHRDVAWVGERDRGFHGSARVKGTPCASCHPDHAGADFALIKWPDGSAERFDHRRAGWALEQSHREAKCEDCHKPANRASPSAKLAAGKSPRYTGLETTCASCHEDVHRGALGARCQQCHDAGKWTTTPGFDHDTTDYALTGRHRNLKCDDCHLSSRLPLKRDPGGRPVPVYEPVPHQTCSSCHDDVHQGQFGANCATCHTTAGFDRISGSGFDHGRTAFPLVGKHVAVKCGDCHADFTTARGRKPPSASCTACHAPDPHAGTATLAGKPADCAACHNERGFTPSTLPRERHQATKYPLEGKHLTVACAACHRKETQATDLGSAKVRLRPASTGCASCHADEHGGQLASRQDRGECAACHRVAGWTPSAFGVAEHAGLSLPLEGRHAEAACAACHSTKRNGLKPLRSDGGKAGFVFRGVESGCAECHLDPHDGRFETGGVRATAGGCRACHDAKAFRPAAVGLEAHAKFRFALRGAHRATPCAGCHKELAVAGTEGPALIASGARVRPAAFQADTSCASCHRSVHGDQFSQRRDGGRCDGCHGDDRFSPAAGFDHDRDASFALGAGHRAVPCASCHTATQLVDGVARPVYRPLSGKCESCHAAKPPGAAPATRRGATRSD